MRVPFNDQVGQIEIIEWFPCHITSDVRGRIAAIRKVTHLLSVLMFVLGNCLN